MVVAQIDAVLSDIGADAVKIGMLANAAIASAVAGALERRPGLPIVLDTVMVAKSGARLLEDEAVRVLIDRLLPLATVVTPNVPEAEAMLGRPIRTPDDLRRAARDLVAAGARAALVKGGHLSGPAVDVLFDGVEQRRSARRSRRHPAHARHRVHLLRRHRRPARARRRSRHRGAPREALHHRRHSARPGAGRWPWSTWPPGARWSARS